MIGQGVDLQEFLGIGGIGTDESSTEDDGDSWDGALRVLREQTADLGLSSHQGAQVAAVKHIIG